MLALLIPGVGMKGVSSGTVVSSGHRRRPQPFISRRRRRRKHGKK